MTENEDNSQISIRNFGDAKVAFDEDMSGDLILLDFAENLLYGSSDGSNVNQADIEDLANDLAPLFDKWVW